MEVVWVALIVFGFALVAGVVLLLRFPEEIRALVGRTQSVQINSKGIALSFFEEAIHTKEDRAPSREEILPDLERISRGRILWVDDSPASIRLEVQALRALGVEIDTATSNEEAMQYATRRDYDLVLSDIGRAPPQDPAAGLALPALLSGSGRAVPVAYYTGYATSPETPGGQPVFDAPTELLRFVANRIGQGSESVATRADR